MTLFKFVFKVLTTVILGIIIGWYLADTQLPLKIKKEFINPIINTSKLDYVTNKLIKN